MQLGFEKTDSDDLNESHRRSNKLDSVQESAGDGKSRQDKDEMSRWQDDGGESGEVV